MEFSRPEAYIRQLTEYLRQNAFGEAFALGKEGSAKFSKNVLVHFLYAKAAFGLRNFDLSAKECRIAVNLASTKEDIVFCAVFEASALYELGKFNEGFERLCTVEHLQKNADVNANVEKLLFIFSLAKNDLNTAMNHLDLLAVLNPAMADELTLKFLS